MLKTAFDQNNLGLETNERGEIVLKVHYPLMEGARICGKIIMRPRTEREEHDEIRGIDRQRGIQAMLFRIVCNGGADNITRMYKDNS